MLRVLVSPASFTCEVWILHTVLLPFVGLLKNITEGLLHCTFNPLNHVLSVCSSCLSSYLFSYCYFVSALNLYSGADLSWGCMVSFSHSKWMCVMCWQDECTVPDSEDSSAISLMPLMRLDENYKVEVGNDTIIYINVCHSLLPVQGLSCLGGSSACVARIHNGSLIDEKV